MHKCIRRDNLKSCIRKLGEEWKMGGVLPDRSIRRLCWSCDKHAYTFIIHMVASDY